MKRLIKHAAPLLLCVLLLVGTALPAFAAGNEFSTDVYLQSGPKITGVTEDFSLTPSGNKTLTVITEGGGLTYAWEISTDGGTTWNTPSGASDSASYDITNAQKNDPETTPYLYRITVTDSLGQSASEIVRVLVHDDYAYATKTDSANGVTVTGFLHKTARLVVELVQTETTASDLQNMIRPGFAPLAAYEVYLRADDGVVLPAYIGRLDITFIIGASYNGNVLNIYHKNASGVIATLTGTVTDGKLPVVTNELSPFLIEVDAATVRSIVVTSGAGGDVFPAGTVYVPTGGDKAFAFTPHTGYVLDTVKVDGSTVSVSGNRYTLTNIQADHTLHATFKRPSGGGGGDDPTTYTITIPATAHGRTSPTGKVTAEHGQSLTIYFYPDTGYELDKVLMNGTEVSAGSNSYTFTVTGSATVKVTFKLKTVTPPVVTRTVTATAGNGGKISPAGTTTVKDGGDLYVYFIPSDGYIVNTVTVDGVRVDAQTFWHFISIRTDHAIHVTFKAKPAAPPDIGTTDPGGADPGQPGPGGTDPGSQHGGTTEPGGTEPGPGGDPAAEHVTITIDVDGEHGGVSPSGEVTVEKGGSQTIYFYPDEGYAVDKVIINGEEVDASSGSYTVENIEGDIEVSVTFKPIDGMAGSCACAICDFWRLVFPKLGCACPWCWLVPLLIALAVGGFILYHSLKKKKVRENTAQPLGKQ
ncbi:MAG: hypothetical protein PHY23_00485 [Oscillospiraceae bacterium]|nr:hypothetical protein [Oscillospiraceae bacterium]